MPVATKVSGFSGGTLPVVYGDCAGDVIVAQYFIDLTAAQIALNNVYDLGILPSYHRVVDMILVPDDLDTNGTPLLSLDVGMMDGTPGDGVASRTVGAEFFSADIAARSGVTSRMSLATGFRVQATETDRSIGLKVAAAAATPAAGRVRLLVFMVQADHRLTF